MNAARWQAYLETNESGDIIQVRVTDADGWSRGRWQAGYADVSAGSLEDKDEVRRLVHWAIGAHVIQASTLRRSRRSTPQA